jgi:hypothetical protein
MSRSYRKPWIVDGYKGSRRKQFYKRYANKRVRNTEDVPNGKTYRRVLNPWDITDYRYMANYNDDWYKEKFWHYSRK